MKKASPDNRLGMFFYHNGEKAMYCVDVIIPTYHPGKELKEMLGRLCRQTCPIHKILIMNTEEKFWDNNLEKEYSKLEVHHVTKKEFDHGGTRKAAAQISEAEIMVFMTQDALPANEKLIENLVNALTQQEMVGAAYTAMCFM